MRLERKQGAATPTGTGTNEYPEELAPPLPDSIKERFPELADWERVARDNYRRLVDVLLRRDRE